MISIGICDDEPYYLNKVQTLLEENLRAAGAADVSLCSFATGKELCADEAFLRGCTALFLDINMQDCNGVELAREIKEIYPDILLVFVTAHIDYVLMGYQVEAFRFLLKDNLENMIRECVPALLAKLKKRNVTISCKLPDGEKVLRVDRISYIESYGHKRIYHFRDTAVTYCEENADSLTNLEEKLVPHGFCRIHKSYLVNMACVDAVECYRLHLEDETKLPIPREKYRMVRETYFRAMGEM